MAARMWRYYPELLERAVPRYTSYPTAAEFGDIDADFHAAGFDLLRPGEPISLYVHIPYCEKICWYCGCNTGAANRPARLSSYLDALHREIETVAASLPGRSPITQIAFGGGSPNAIAPVDFVRLLNHLIVAFDAAPARLSIELDPRSLTPDWIETIGRTGISHASMGVQTFDADIQAAIGRVQPFEAVERQLTALRHAGVTSINFDLMYGLPGQGLDEMARTLDETIAMRPERIALFGYAHLPSLLPRQRRIDDSALPDARLRFAMAELGHEKLLATGYEAIGFDHFALPGDGMAKAARSGTLRRNFQGFTDDPAATLIGLGASAISALPDRFVQNEKNSGRYRMKAGAGNICGMRGVMRKAADRETEAIIASLLCSMQAEIRPSAVPAPSWRTIETLQAAGLADYRDGTLRLCEDARPYSRFVASLFDEYRTTSAGSFSQAI